VALAVRITLLLLGLVVAGVFAASVWLLTLDLEPYEQAIERATSKALDRDFEIEGDLGLVLALFPTISADGIRLGNASWGTTGDLLQIERAEGVIRPLPLLRGRLEFSRLVFFQPVVRLETDAQGRGNWMFDDGEPASEEAERAISLPAALEDLEALQIERGALDLRHASGRLERSVRPSRASCWTSRAATRKCPSRWRGRRESSTPTFRRRSRSFPSTSCSSWQTPARRSPAPFSAASICPTSTSPSKPTCPGSDRWQSCCCCPTPGSNAHR
jgi:hypothetical protein